MPLKYREFHRLMLLLCCRLKHFFIGTLDISLQALIMLRFIFSVFVILKLRLSHWKCGLLTWDGKGLSQSYGKGSLFDSFFVYIANNYLVCDDLLMKWFCPFGIQKLTLPCLILNNGGAYRILGTLSFDSLVCSGGCLVRRNKNTCKKSVTFNEHVEVHLIAARAITSKNNQMAYSSGTNRFDLFSNFTMLSANGLY